MIRKYVWQGDKFVEKVRKDSGLHFVQGDIAEFTANDGVRIGGKRQWREHLKRTNTIEMNGADMARQTEKWQAKKADHQARIANSEKRGVRPVTAPDGPIVPIDRSRLSAEIANRLDGRPIPERKMLIKLTREVAIDLARRR